MNVVLVRPDAGVYRRFKLGRRKIVLPPLGLLYLASVLERGGHTVHIVDAEAEGLTLERAVEKTLSFRPDIVGAGATTPEMPTVAEFLRRVKESSGETVTIAGGFHPSALPAETLKESPWIDFVVRGEGEVTLSELVRVLESGGEYETIDGIGFRKDRRIVLTRPRPPIMNVDEIPFPARHLVDPENYKMPVPGEGLVRSTMVQTSRGCPYRCIFCYRSKDPAPLRPHSPEYVVNELEEAVRRYGVRGVVFADDTFTFSKKRTIQISNMIVERGLDIHWYCLTGTVWQGQTRLTERCWLL